MAKKKARFQWFKTEALNPETLEEDLDWWVVRDTATNELVSEHDNPRSAKNLCKLLNKAAELAYDMVGKSYGARP